MAHMTVTKEDGVELFDTDLISYGLVKSGYMAYIESWSRRQKAALNTDPNDGNSWSPVLITTNPAYRAEAMHGFTVTATAPIVFITGRGTSAGFRRVGNTVTYYYANASPSTKYYCFDLMADNIAGSPYLKTYNSDGVLTFNSLQPPLNVVETIQAPVPGAVINNNNLPAGSRATAYTGGYNVADFSGAISQYNLSRLLSIRDLPLTAGVEYAAFLPWSRSIGIFDYNSMGNQDMALYGGAEGAYGRVGGMSFMFGPSGGSTYAPNAYFASVNAFTQIPTDRYPVAMVIETTNLPFPYN